MKLIYCDSNGGLPMADATGAELDFDPFYAGETKEFGLRFLRTAPGGGFTLDDPNLKSLTATISLVDKRPTGGSLAYQVGSGASTADNTTAALNWNHSAKALQDAINAVAAIVTAYGSATVEAVTGGFAVKFANATAATPIQARTNQLTPTSVLRVFAYEIGGVWWNELRHVQAPMELNSTWARVLPAQPAITLVRDGAVDASNTYKTTEVQKLTVQPEFRGTYQLRRPETETRTALLSTADGPEEIQTALQALYEDGTIKVTNPGENYALIEFTGDLAGEDVGLLEVVVGEAPPGDPTIAIDLLRPGVYQALRATETAPAFFEIRAYIAAADADAEDPGKPRVLFRAPITLTRDLNFDALASVVDPLWLRPPEPVDYVPTTPDQVSVGVAHYVGLAGNGSAQTFVIDHNLATDDISTVTVIDNTNGAVFTAPTDFTWSVTNDNSITIEITDPYFIPISNGLKVIITTATPVSAWEPHTHTQEQIVDLVDDLDALRERLSDVEDKYESIGIPAAATSSTVGLTVDLPKTAELCFYGGDAAALIDEKLGLKRIPTADEQSRPYLLPAIHDASLDALTDPLPTPSSNAGKVYDPSASVRISPGGGIPSRIVLATGFVGCDGRSLYEVTRQGATSSYHPTAYERTLWTLPINEKMLRAKRTLAVEWGVQAQLAAADCEAQWSLIVEQGAITVDASPGTPGSNIASITWTEIFSQAFQVDALLQTHFFGIKIARDAGGTITLDQGIYGVYEGNNAAAPASANFVLRARLARWDVENAPSLPRGWLFWRLVGAAVQGETETTFKPAKATIS